MPISRPRLSFAIVIALASALAASAAEAKDWDVRAHGRVVYDDGSGSKPVVGAVVKVMDEDTLVDETLGQARTNADGRFDIRVRGSDPKLPLGICNEACSRPDIYVTVQLANDRIDVQTEIGFTWHANTSVHGNTAGDIDFGQFKFSSKDGQGAEILFGRATQQYDHYTSLVGGRIPRHDGKIGVLYPAVLANGTPWTTEESIHWPGDHSRWDAMFHEFGHRIRHAADGDFGHFLEDVAKYKYPQHHNYEMKSNAGFAFNEGWAEYHSTMLDPKSKNAFSHWKALDGGDVIEGNVAAKLMHLSDTCGGFKNMWAALQSTKIHSYAQFEAAMRKKFPACFVKVRALAAPLALDAHHMVPITLGEQTAAISRLVAASAARPLAPPVRVMQLRAAPRELQPQAAALDRLSAVRVQAHLDSTRAAQSALQKHYLAFKPITAETATNGKYRIERQDARHAFLNDALSPQLAQIEKVLAQLKVERSRPDAAPIAEHLDQLKVRYEGRKTELKAALAMTPSPDMKIPVHLLPRSFGAEVVPSN